jgi:hypothetical protein
MHDSLNRTCTKRAFLWDMARPLATNILEGACLPREIYCSNRGKL